MRASSFRALTAVRAQTPESDVRLVHQISGVVGGCEARCLSDRAVDVGDAAALSANEVMVVVSDPAFVACRAPRRFDSPYESCCGERVQCLVDGLERHVAEAVAYLRGDRVDVQMVAGAHCVEDGEPNGRHPEAGGAELGGGVRWVVRVLHGFERIFLNLNDSR
jgi:hypothetical protein